MFPCYPVPFQHLPQAGCLLFRRHRGARWRRAGRHGLENITFAPARSLAAQSVNSGHVIICFLLGQLVVELIQDYSSIFKDIQHFGDSCFDFTYLTTAYRCVIITARKYWLNQNPHGDRICSHLNYLVECTDSSSVGRHWSWRHYIRMNFVKTTYE